MLHVEACLIRLAPFHYSLRYFTLVLGIGFVLPQSSHIRPNKVELACFLLENESLQKIQICLHNFCTFLLLLSHFQMGGGRGNLHWPNKGGLNLDPTEQQTQIPSISFMDVCFSRV